MRLSELEPEFLKIINPTSYRTDAVFTDCDGIFFLCPVCFKNNNGAVGTHGIICWKPHVPQTMEPKPGRWPFTGTGFTDLSLTPSVLINADCKAHFFVTNGEIVGC